MNPEAYYLDTNIWLDHYEKRGTRGKAARQLFRKLIMENAIIYYSDLHIQELKRIGYYFEEIETILHVIRPKNMRHAHLSREQGAEARRIARERRVPLGDAIHAILARDNYAVLVSQDEDFEKLRDITVAETTEHVLMTNP